jgi:hypothetical protein
MFNDDVKANLFGNVLLSPTFQAIGDALSASLGFFSLGLPQALHKITLGDK